MAELMLKRLADFRSVPVGKVIKADAYSALVASDAAIAAIEKEAEALFEQTRQAARAKALEEADAEIREQQMRTAVATVDFLANLEQRLAELVAEGVRRVIGEFELSDATVRMIENLLNQLRWQHRIKLSVSPGLLQEVTAGLNRLRDAHPNVEQIEVAVDPGLPTAVCRLETPLSTVQTSVDEQIEALRSALSAGS